MAKVGVIFGGRSVEHQVSLNSARTVTRALTEAGHETIPLGIAQDGCWLGHEASAAALSGGIKSIEPLGIPVPPTLRHLLAASLDVVFPIVHGTWGEDGTLQGLCEMLGIAYVGAGVTASALAMDKLQCKRVLEAAGVPVVEYRAAVRGGGAIDVTDLPLPLFVKPSVGGSSVGIRKVESADQVAEAVAFALRFDDAVVVERGVAGRELECAVLGYPDLQASAIGEIVPGNDFYDYEDKYLQDKAGLIAPADVPGATADAMRAMAVKAFAAIGGSGMARVDFFLEQGTDKLYVNEINTLPGFTRISMYPRLWEISGLPPARLVDRLVDCALRRHRDRQRLDSGIKDWLTELARRA
ncbi:MAG: D-alanine--D-alanine ligase family protein [Acidobacteriota bacterium]